MDFFVAKSLTNSEDCEKVLNVSERVVPTWVVGQRCLLVEGIVSLLSGTRFHARYCRDTIADFNEDQITSEEPPLLCLHIADHSANRQSLEEVVRIRQKLPFAIVISIISSSDLTAQSFVDAGADGCFRDTLSIEELKAIMKLLVNGPENMAIRSFMSELHGEQPSASATPCIMSNEPTLADLSRAVEALEEKLSYREKKVLVHLAEGASNKVLARQLAISEATVKAHVRTIFRKLGVHSRSQAVFRLLEHR